MTCEGIDWNSLRWIKSKTAKPVNRRDYLVYMMHTRKQKLQSDSILSQQLKYLNDTSEVLSLLQKSTMLNFF